MRLAAVGDVTAFHREPEVTAVQRPDTRFHTHGDRVIVSGA